MLRGRTYIEEFGAAFGTKTVKITPGPEQPGRSVIEVQGLVQTKTVGFNVDTPVYEGDQLSWDDPRGGEMAVWAHEVDVADAPGLGSEMAHIKVKFSKTAPHRSPKPRGSGHTIIIHGSHVNVALEGSNITQQGD